MRRAHILPVLVVVLGLVLLPARPALSSVIFSWSPDAPTGNMLASHSFPFNNHNWPWQWVGDVGSEHMDLGQSFLIVEPHDVMLDKITVKLGSIGYGAAAAGADYRLEVWTTTDGWDWSGNALVDSQTGVLPDPLPPARGWGIFDYWTFDIQDILLLSGQHYAFMFAFEDGPVAGLHVRFANAYGSNYPYGRMMARRGTPSAWSTEPHDLEFYVQGAAAGVIPEPGTLALMLAGLSGLGLVRLRRRRR